MRSAIVLLIATSFLAAQSPSYSDTHPHSITSGTLVGYDYTNGCLGITFKIPAGWVSTPSTASGLAARQGKDFLLLDLVPSTDESGKRHIRLYAKPVGSSASSPAMIVKLGGQEYVAQSPNTRELINGATSSELGGREFARATMKQSSSKAVVYTASLVSKFRNYFLAVHLIANSPEELEATLKDAQGFKFDADTPDPNCADDPALKDADKGTKGAFSSAPEAPKNGRIRIAESEARSLLVKKVDPVTPKDATLPASVRLSIVIGRDGHVTSVRPMAGNAALATAAAEAVKQWEFRPYVMNGQPLIVDTIMTLPFVNKE